VAVDGRQKVCAFICGRMVADGVEIFKIAVNETRGPAANTLAAGFFVML
jgi:hypothetical protein